MGFLCSLLLLASCHSDDNEPTLMDDEPQTVTISINLADAYTRTVNENEDDALSRLLMQVIDNGTAGAVEKISFSGTSFTTSIELYPSHSYTFLFWADDGHYDNVDALTYITTDSQRPEAGLAYAACVEWKGETTINATLAHVTSKVTLKTTSKVWAGNELTLNIPNTYSGYNVEEGVPVEENGHELNYDYTPATDITATEDNPVELFSFYVLAADEEQDLTLSCDGGSITVPVNLSGGKHITLTGDVGGMTEEKPTSSTLDVTFGAWDDFTFELDNLLTDATVASASLAGTGTEDDPYLINNPADFKRYMDDVTYRNGKYALLNTDIQIITDNWTPMDVFFGATFDGGGHTISGEIKHEGGESGDVYAGVFRDVKSDCTICNLEVSANISVTATGTATSYIYAGGIAGMLSPEGTITGCTYSGTLTVTGTAQINLGIGGIAGTSNGTISGCTFSGKIDATGASATLSKSIGGIAGENHGTSDDTNKDEGTVYQ